MKGRWIAVLIPIIINIGCQSYFIFFQGVSELTSLFLMITLSFIAFSTFILMVVLYSVFGKLTYYFKYLLVGSLSGLLLSYTLTSYINKKRRKEFTTYLHSPYNNPDSTMFKLHDDSLTEIPMASIAANKVQVLRIWSKELKSLPENLGTIRHLQRLELIAAKKLDLEQAFGVLTTTNIQSLTITSSDIRYLPPSLASLNSLKEVSFSSNPQLDLDSLIALLKLIPRLEKLSITHSDAVSLPSTIKELKKLKELQLSFGEFTELPTELSEMDSLKSLVLNEVPVIKNWWLFLDSANVKFKVIPEHQWKTN